MDKEQIYFFIFSLRHTKNHKFSENLIIIKNNSSFKIKKKNLNYFFLRNSDRVSTICDFLNMQPQEKKVLMKPEAEVYKRIKKLGEGSFGKVYLVRCLKSNTLYALKQIDMNDKSPEEVKKTFSEAKILESLKHPNIVNFHEVYKTKKGRLCIVMDYADGLLIK